MTAPVSNQPSVFSRITGSVQDGFHWVKNLPNNPTFTSTLESMDPFGKTPSNPKWLRLATIGGAAVSFLTSVYLICKSKWLEKSLKVRRITGALLFVPVFYVVGYGIYNLFIKNSQWNQNRLFEKFKAENETKCASLVVDIQSKPTEEQYDAIVDFANNKNFSVKWDSKSVEFFFTHNLTKAVCASKHSITDELYNLSVKKRLEEALNKDNELLNNAEATEEEVDVWRRGFRENVLAPLGLSLENCIFPKKQLIFVVEKDGEEIYSHAICAEVKEHLRVILPGLFYNTRTSNVKDSQILD